MTGPPPLTPASQRLRQQLSLPDPEPSEYEDTEAHEAAVEADLQHSASTVTVLEKRIGMFQFGNLLKLSSSSHSKLYIRPCTRLLKCFVFHTLCSKTKHLRSKASYENLND